MSGVTTSYEQIPSRINDLAADGGAWTKVDERFSVTSRQQVGGVSNLFLLSGQMVMRVSIPSGVLVSGGPNSYRWKLSACLVDSECASTVYTGFPSLSIPTPISSCPTMTEDFTFLGDMESFGTSFGIFVSSPSVGGTFCRVNVGKFEFVINPQLDTVTSPGSSSTTLTSSTISSTVTSATSTNTTLLTNTATTNTSIFTTKADQSAIPQPSITFGPNGQSTGGLTSNDSTNSKEVGTGVIVGGVLGGIAAVIFIAFLIWWMRGRKTRKADESQWQKERTATVLGSDSDLPSNSSSEAETQMPFVIPPSGLGDMRSIGGMVVTGPNVGVGAGMRMRTVVYQQQNNLPLQLGYGHNVSTEHSLGSTPLSDYEALRETSPTNPNTNLHANPANLMTNSNPTTPPVSGQLLTPQTLPVYASPMGDGPPIYQSVGTQNVPLYMTPIAAMPHPSHLDPMNASTMHVPSNQFNDGAPAAGTSNNTGYGDANNGNVANSHYFESSSTSNSLSLYSDDPIGIWAQENRSFITPDFERRLRMAGYLPEFDPDAMTEDTWLNRYGVSPFELQTLKRLHLRRRLNTQVTEY